MLRQYLFYTDGKSGARECRKTMLDNIETARNEGIKYAGTIVSNDPERLRTSGEFRVDVTDETDLLLFTIITLVIDSPAARRS